MARSLWPSTSRQIADYSVLSGILRIPIKGLSERILSTRALVDRVSFLVLSHGRLMPPGTSTAIKSANPTIIVNRPKIVESGEALLDRIGSVSSALSS